ncbi:MAG: GNAT family N-acetyltransferase [Caulobacterales bacterium]
MKPYEVRIARPAEQDALLDTLLLAFSTDPCIRYTFPKAETYLAAFRPFAAAMGGRAIGAGAAYVADDGAAAALWLPPGVEGDSAALGELVGAYVAADKQQVLGEVVAGMSKFHPHEPHWYLAMIGVDPSRQGQGLGSAILKESLKRCDADGIIAYLESSNPKNVPLYERHGFEVMGLIQPGDFPPLYPMLRPARG